MRAIGGYRLMLLCCLALTSVVAGCGSSDSSSTDAASTTDTTATTPAKTTTTPAPIKNTFARPKSPGPHPGAKIERLIVKDVVKGTGAEVHAGDTAIVEFVLSNWATGKEIDASWGKKKPYQTQIESSVVIAGWAQGVPGMRVGGRRTLLIPPALGFTSNPNPNVHGKMTYFDIVLLGVIPAKPVGVGDGSGATGANSGEGSIG